MDRAAEVEVCVYYYIEDCRILGLGWAITRWELRRTRYVREDWDGPTQDGKRTVYRRLPLEPGESGKSAYIGPELVDVIRSRLAQKRLRSNHRTGQ